MKAKELARDFLFLLESGFDTSGLGGVCDILPEAVCRLQKQMVDDMKDACKARNVSRDHQLEPVVKEFCDKYDAVVTRLKDAAENANTAISIVVLSFVNEYPNGQSFLDLTMPEIAKAYKAIRARIAVPASRRYGL